jgi:DNA invertase Pin-like site-specific DNA recombinase
MEQAKMTENTLEQVKLVGLLRVSTGKQELSGLGLEGQSAAIEAYRTRIGGQLIKTFTEVESGTHDDVESRPKLMAAIRYALRHNAILAIAKMDRLVRSKRVFAYLQDTRVKFVMCDNPQATELTIDILVAVAANEARQISQRTKAALQAYKAGKHVSKRIKAKYDGKVPANVVKATAGKLGSSLPQCQGHLTAEARKRGGEKSAAKRKDAAIKAYAYIADDIRSMRNEGLKLREIAARLNQRDRDEEPDQVEQDKPTWSTMKVKRILDRLA